MPIKNLETIAHLECLLGQDSSQTLLLFDVGDVLLIPEGALLQGEVKAEREKLRKEFLASQGEERHRQLWSRILINEKRRLVEQQTPFVIKKLQSNGVKVMALTALQTGPFGDIENMEDWRLAHLAAYDIHFTQDFVAAEHFVLDELRQEGFSPVYKRGALFTYKQPKGQALTAFLNRIDWRPQHIAFVDDKMPNIEDVAAAAEALMIPFTGLHYQVAQKLTKPLDEVITVKRIKHLVDQGVWLREDEIDR